jgi:hypothetical protein
MFGEVHGRSRFGVENKKFYLKSPLVIQVRFNKQLNAFYLKA